MLRLVVFRTWVYGSMVVLGLLFAPSVFLPRQAALFGIRLWTRGVRGALRLIYGVRTEIRGMEHAPQGAAIVASKHQSLYDTIIGFLFLSDHTTVMKRELLRAPVFGQYAMKVGVVPVDRGAGAKALRAMTAAVAAQFAEGRQVLIYPEGTRTEPGAPPDYKPGVYAIYKATGAVCAPMATNSGVFWPGGGRTIRPGAIVYDIRPSLPAGLDRKTFMTRLQDAIEPASDALLEEARASGAR